MYAQYTALPELSDDDSSEKSASTASSTLSTPRTDMSPSPSPIKPPKLSKVQATGRAVTVKPVASPSGEIIQLTVGIDQLSVAAIPIVDIQVQQNDMDDVQATGLAVTIDHAAAATDCKNEDMPDAPHEPSTTSTSTRQVQEDTKKVQQKDVDVSMQDAAPRTESSTPHVANPLATTSSQQVQKSTLALVTVPSVAIRARAGFTPSSQGLFITKPTLSAPTTAHGNTPSSGGAHPGEQTDGAMAKLLVQAQKKVLLQTDQVSIMFAHMFKLTWETKEDTDIMIKHFTNHPSFGGGKKDVEKTFNRIKLHVEDDAVCMSEYIVWVCREAQQAQELQVLNMELSFINGYQRTPYVRRLLSCISKANFNLMKAVNADGCLTWPEMQELAQIEERKFFDDTKTRDNLPLYQERMGNLRRFWSDKANVKKLIADRIAARQLAAGPAPASPSTGLMPASAPQKRKNEADGEVSKRARRSPTEDEEDEDAPEQKRAHRSPSEDEDAQEPKVSKG